MRKLSSFAMCQFVCFHASNVNCLLSFTNLLQPTIASKFLTFLCHLMQPTIGPTFSTGKFVPSFRFYYPLQTSRDSTPYSPTPHSPTPPRPVYAFCFYFRLLLAIRFCALWSCGCVLSMRALKVFKGEKPAGDEGQSADKHSLPTSCPNVCIWQTNLNRDSFKVIRFKNAFKLQLTLLIN